MAIEVLVIGSEILLGETLDTNTQVIARTLRGEGYDLQRIVAVGDDAGRIAEAVRSAARGADAVITTGGLGPTVDDPTRRAAAEAAGVELVFDEQAWRDIQARYTRHGRIPTENNRVQAFLPKGAQMLANRFGTAPGFALSIGSALVLSLPGVPAEMEPMLRQALPLLRRRLGALGVLRIRTIHIAGLPESQIDELVGDLERTENPRVGLAAYPARTDIRIAARGKDEAEALDLLQRTETEIRVRLTGHIYGVDDRTLAGAVLEALPKDSSLLTAEWGTCGALAAAFSVEKASGFLSGWVLPESGTGRKPLMEILSSLRKDHGASHALGARLTAHSDGSKIEYAFASPESARSDRRMILIPEAAARKWAVNSAMILLWESLREDIS
jgi:nicotinamide-nucleotide amidase